jgi:nucleoside-diphosphate-sugar epimerase
VGDVYHTYADATELERELSFVPKAPLENGLRELASWYRRYYRIGA